MRGKGGLSAFVENEKQLRQYTYLACTSGTLRFNYRIGVYDFKDQVFGSCVNAPP